MSFGATEYMDGALTLPVLKELFLRGAPSRDRGRPSRGRELTYTEHDDVEEQDRERRGDCRDLEAIDLTGCVSAVFVNALTEFVNVHILQSADSDSSGSEDEGSRGVRRARFSRVVQEPLVLPGLKRLGLRGVKSIQPHVLTPFVLSFPSLTHLDLSGTRVTPELLYSIGASQTVRLQSLALARCVMLTGESVKDFLVHAPAAAQIQELTLYGDRTFPSQLSVEELREIFALAPCFVNGGLVYLDLSSTPVTKDMLDEICKPMPKLRSLGLSYIHDLELDVVVKFLKTKAPNVEVLTLNGTSPQLEQRTTARETSIALHTKLIRPLSALQFSFGTSASQAPLPTKVRVIELPVPVLSDLGIGAGAWRIIKSKGGRGWYVDTASGWVDGVLRRDLEKDHPLRVAMERLADANGNVSSGVGWHARKMEVSLLCLLNLLFVFELT